MGDHTLLEGLRKLGPWGVMSIPDAQRQLEPLARRVAASREDIALTDAEDTIIALVVSPAALEDLEDELAATRAELRKLRGEAGVPHEEVVRDLRGSR
ncbi:type II toxin-antitoxin system prevent-host-death family antitoxin [Streptomyces marincola]|uniref:type II toxin-antitoxin system prevent-host-death family antitoxin n=1 Tax=Streptomyces marincola TaxID=2878388 RepID=UPI001CF45A97|nr:type II toxin-antitoxin system prevent-host-death family antitoxin [Streptomyces marincola]UCM88267.1 type II toxin-antitoxin system prevent-host-death family antitoxin [Streptomyces marincola]